MTGKKLFIAVGGIHYPLSMMSYFIRALKRRDDVEVFTFGPFTGDWIPWNGGMRIPQKYIHVPNLSLPQNMINTPVPSSLFNHAFPKTPDLTLLIDAGWHPANRPLGKIVAHVQTDPHAISKEFYRKAKEYSDFCFNMQLSYSEPDEKYLPYAADTEVFYPEDVPKEYDACLVGLHYEQRDRLVEALRKRGLNVYYSIGEVFDEYRMVYNKSKIALNWSSMDDLNARTFEAMAMGLPLVTNRVSDLSNFFVENEHYFGFSSLQEAVDKVEYLIYNADIAQIVGDNAYRKVVAMHTWEVRISQLLETCGFGRL